MFIFLNQFIELVLELKSKDLIQSSTDKIWLQKNRINDDGVITRVRLDQWNEMLADMMLIQAVGHIVNSEEVVGGKDLLRR